MKKLARETIKQIFKKVKHLRIDKNFENVEFEKLKYYSWIDPSDNTLFVVYPYKKKIQGIAFETTLMSKASSKLAFCEICKKHKSKSEVALATAKTKKKPKGVHYRARGNYICTDYIQCNKDAKNMDGLDRLFYSILEEE